MNTYEFANTSLDKNAPFVAFKPSRGGQDEMKKVQPFNLPPQQQGDLPTYHSVDPLTMQKRVRKVFHNPNKSMHDGQISRLITQTSAIKGSQRKDERDKKEGPSVMEMVRGGK